MFSLNSLNSQNQILVCFSQLSSRYSSLYKQRKQHNGKNKNVKGKESATAPYDATICQESLGECLRNFDKGVLNEMRNVDLRALVTLNRPQRTSLTSAKKVSYISAETFDKNKNGWVSQATPTITVDLRGKNTKFNFTDNFVGLLARSLHQNSFNYNVQVRGFKTERGVHADLKRNPNIINRLLQRMDPIPVMMT